MELDSSKEEYEMEELRGGVQITDRRQEQGRTSVQIAVSLFK